MSRIGKMPITIPAGVDVKIGADNEVTVKGAKATLTRKLHPNMIIKAEGGVITVERPNEEKMNKALHGLTRTLINNMVIGVTEGYKKSLVIAGVGYKVAKQGKKVVMNVGYSHPVEIEEIDGITLECPSVTEIVVTGIDKTKVGQFAANIRSVREPEPYHGYGIHYSDEVIERKEGKTAGK